MSPKSKTANTILSSRQFMSTQLQDNRENSVIVPIGLFEEGTFEAEASECRLVTVVLPDGNQVNSTIHPMETAQELKKQHLQHYYYNLKEYEVVLCKENNKKMVLQDNEEFLNYLFNFDYIEIRSRQQHLDTVQALQSCIVLKTPFKGC